MAHTNEPRSETWSRRAKTVPAMLVFTALGFSLAPVALPFLAVADLIRGRPKLPRARVYLFLLQYGFNDSLELVLAPIYWAFAGFGRTLGSQRSIRRHSRLQEWSAGVLERRAKDLLGIEMTIDTQSMAALMPGGCVVATRHVNLIDASITGLLYQRHGIRSRGVIMEDLLIDPGFDILFGRLGSVFVSRRGEGGAKSLIRSLGADLEDDSVALIYPEGRLFTPKRLTRAKEKLAKSDPERHRRLQLLEYVLPPIAGGTRELLLGAESADLVIVSHVGLDRYRSFSHLVSQAPKPVRIEVRAQRFERSSIPTSETEFALWLDERWLEIDDWVRHNF